jgi:hypothetical protein
MLQDTDYQMLTNIARIRNICGNHRKANSAQHRMQPDQIYLLRSSDGQKKTAT